LIVGPWNNWPAKSYQRPSYRNRLVAVQDHLARCLDAAPAGPVRIVSLCAGDGRDVLGVLQTHERRNDVRAWLVELDRESVKSGTGQAAAAGLEDRVTFIQGDATDFANYTGIVPCQIVLVCGVLGHVPPADRQSLIEALKSFCTSGGMVIWTRGLQRGLDRFTEFQQRFEQNDFERVQETRTEDEKWGICSHRYTGPYREPPKSGRIFEFTRIGGRE
jgi:hypothetical protein